MTLGGITVEYVDVKAFTWTRIQHAPRNAAVPGRLVDVGLYQLRPIRLGVVTVEVLVVHECVEHRRKDFPRLHPTELVAHVEHVIPAPPARAGVGRERAIAGERLDLQEDVALFSAAGRRHGYWCRGRRDSNTRPGAR